METMAAHIGGELSDLVPVVTRGYRLDRDACLRLWRTDDLTGLGVLANLVRERVNGNRTFFRAALRASAGEDLESLLRAPPAEGVAMPDPTGYNCLRAIAVGRLCLDRMPHVRGSVEALGESVMQVAQWYGADDAGSVAPPARERLAELLRAAGREPVELLIE